MLKPLYEYKKHDETIYDSVHEYCLTEKVSEERLRALVKKDKRSGKHAVMHGFLSTCLSYILSIGSLLHVGISAEGRLE